MRNSQPDEAPAHSAGEIEKKQATLKNHNPNQNHNVKKESLGPNTKR